MCVFVYKPDMKRCYSHFVASQISINNMHYPTGTAHRAKATYYSVWVHFHFYNIVIHSRMRLEEYSPPLPDGWFNIRTN